MSELKSFKYKTMHINIPMEVEVYLKSEADKVIADLEESHKMEVEQLLMEIAEKDAENSRLKCELDLWRDGNIIRKETLNEINSAHRALCRLRIGFAKHFGRVNSGKKIVAYWKAKVEKFKEAM